MLPDKREMFYIRTDDNVINEIYMEKFTTLHKLSNLYEHLNEDEIFKRKNMKTVYFIENLLVIMIDIHNLNHLYLRDYLCIGGVDHYRTAIHLDTSILCRVSYAASRTIHLPQEAMIHFKQMMLSCCTVLHSASSQIANLPITFRSGFTKLPLVTSMSAWQQYIPLQPVSQDTDQPSFFHIAQKVTTVAVQRVTTAVPEILHDSNLVKGKLDTSSLTTTKAGYTIQLHMSQGDLVLLSSDQSTIQLHPNLHGCLAIVQDQRFPGLRPIVLPVHFMEGYSLSMFAEQDENWRQHHIQLIQVQNIPGLSRIVYIGRLGLMGGMGGGHCKFHSCTTPYVCSICDYPCPKKECEACCEHKIHQCAERVREQKLMKEEATKKSQALMRQQEERASKELMRQQKERESKELMRQQKERESKELMRQQKERESKELMRQQKERESKELMRQQKERERQAVLSKLDHTLSFAPTTEDFTYQIQSESIINVGIAYQTPGQDEYLYHGTTVQDGKFMEGMHHSK